MSARVLDVAPARDPHAFAGRVETLVVESELLAGNPAGEPRVRPLYVYHPPGVSEAAELPALWLLAAFTSRPEGFLDPHPWNEGVARAFDRAVAAGEAPPARLVMPDAFTRLGGSQYVDSSYHGPFEQYVARELVPLAEERAPGPRGVLGKSSGGFGALRLAMRHPDVFSACASISGDCGFEYAYGPELLAFLRGLAAHGMDPARFLEEFRRAPDLSGDGHAVVNVLAMSACYSPDPESPLGFALPVDLETGERVDAVWRRWLAFDPLFEAPRHADALRRLRLLHLECGVRDEFHLQWGLRRLAGILTGLGVPHVHEEHEGGHRGLNGRVLRILPRMARALAPSRTNS